jgi:DNA modification methylase
VVKTKPLTEYMEGFEGRKRFAIGDFSWVNPSTPWDKFDLNWREKDLPEYIRTKHVHRLHPYLGKYIPQLVEIMLRKFNPRIVCDPFSGSGTTLVEANALGIASIGCDISSFNCLLARVKTDHYDLRKLAKEIKDIISKTTAILAEDPSKGHKLIEEEPSTYLKKWFHKDALAELLVYRSLIQNYEYDRVLKVILSRSARSSRLTTHFDLDFPTKPQMTPYWCYKHSRTCQPTKNALLFLKRYSEDTIERIKEFSEIQTDAPVDIFCDDSRTFEFPESDCIMTSPPYVGLIDYHEQHRYSYELLNLPDRRESEIGPASSGHSKKAQLDYINQIGEVFSNVRKNMKKNGVAIIVVHDKNKLYSDLSEKCGFSPEKVLERHVDRRTGRRSTEFFEQVLVWKAD